MISQRLSAQRLRLLLGDWRGAGHGYHELGIGIELLVRDGAIAPGTALPAERPLAEALEVSRTTVSACYRMLRENGIALSRRGSGTVVRMPRPLDPHDGGDPVGRVIDLSVAAPSPWRGVAELSARAHAEHPEAFLDSGYDTIGDPRLRAAIADRFTRRGLATTPDQIMVTLGAQHAIFLIARTLLGRGERSLIESPSYPHAREALAATGALVAELPIGTEGYDIPGTLDILRRTSPRLTYLIPDHHNPTGRRMPEEMRSALIAQLAAQGSYAIADETTAELVLGEPGAVRPFACSAEHAHQRDGILTVGSVGKTVWGGLRVGWIRAAPNLIARLEASRRLGDLGTATWPQLVAAAAFDRYDEILSDRTRELTVRHRLLTGLLSERLPQWHPSPALGGATLWVDLGSQRSTALSRACADRGVHLVPGPRFGSPGVFERFVRLPFTLPESDLVEAVERLEDAWGVAPSVGPALSAARDAVV